MLIPVQEYIPGPRYLVLAPWRIRKDAFHIVVSTTHLGSRPQKISAFTDTEIESSMEKTEMFCEKH